MAYVLFRGEYDKHRDQVKPDTPAMLPPMPADLPKNRLGFAHWLLRPEHPLTARVTVNRFWQEVFGTGIVRTTGDFGVGRRAALASGAARLAGGRVPRIGLGREEVLPLLVTSADLSPGGDAHAGEAGKGSAEPAALARAALPHGRRDGPRLRPGRQRPAGRRRSAGRASGRISRRRRLGSGGDDRQQHARLQAGPRREPLSPQHVHVLEAGRPAGLDGHLQRPQPRDLHRPPRADQHAAAGAGHAERSAVRRSGPAPGRRRRSRTAAQTDEAGSTSSPGDCWPGRCAPRKRRWCRRASNDLLDLLQGPRRRRQAS